MNTRTLIIPGWKGSGPDHWQSMWEQEHPEYERVEQLDWDYPRVTDWLTALHAQIMTSPEPVVLVAHSLGVIAVAWWSYLRPQDARERIAGALLVAPCDLEAGSYRPQALQSFPPPPPASLPFPSIVVGSENDFHSSPEAAQRLAVRFGSEFVNAGYVGHLNTESGHGPWPEGEQLLVSLLNSIDARQLAA